MEHCFLGKVEDLSARFLSILRTAPLDSWGNVMMVFGRYLEICEQERFISGEEFFIQHYGFSTPPPYAKTILDMIGCTRYTQSLPSDLRNFLIIGLFGYVEICILHNKDYGAQSIQFAIKALEEREETISQESTPYFWEE